LAHNLATKKDGTAAMMYVGSEGKPWHGLGKAIEKAATSAEAIKAAGLDFEVEAREMFTTHEDKRMPVPARKAMVRTDTGDVLGTVGNVYRPVQNREAFAFLDTLTADQITYHTAGALGSGERVWMLAKVPGEIRVGKTDDVSEQFLLLSNTHDGSQSLRCLFTPIRVVCQNTLSYALRGGVKTGVTIWHIGDMKAKVDEARQILGLAVHSFDQFGAAATALAATKMKTVDVASYFKAVLPMPEDPEKSKLKAKNVEETHAEWFRLFAYGAGQDMPGVKGTLWAAYNAVTEWTDHKPVKARATQALEDARSSRLESIWFGKSATLKARAFEQAMAIVR
jgi:phage/plasmid-like protein (TIGR03299 family)